MAKGVRADSRLFQTKTSVHRSKRKKQAEDEVRLESSLDYLTKVLEGPRECTRRFS